MIIFFFCKTFLFSLELLFDLIFLFFYDLINLTEIPSIVF